VAKNSNFYPVILAGGRGTRFWPLSRKKRAKQLLALDGRQTMMQQTVARLLPLASPKQIWVISNDDLRPAILKQLPRLPKAQVLAEPIGRNTAPAIGLAAFLLLRENPDAVIGMFPSDHVIADEVTYRATIERGVEIAAAGENIVVLGIRPNRAETGYGYIEAGSTFSGNALRVCRFTEKPNAEKAATFVAAGLLVDAHAVRIASGLVLIAWAIYHWAYGHRHRVRFGMQAGLVGLGVWSFLMATAHGAGLMLWPALMPLCAGASPDRAVATALAGIAVHTLAMLTITAAIAISTYWPSPVRSR